MTDTAIPCRSAVWRFADSSTTTSGISSFERLVRDEGWERPYAEQAGTRRLSSCTTAPRIRWVRRRRRRSSTTAGTTPILHTRAYQALGDQLAGRFIHGDPDDVTIAPATSTLRRSPRTVAAMRNVGHPIFD